MRSGLEENRGEEQKRIGKKREEKSISIRYNITPARNTEPDTHKTAPLDIPIR